MTQFAVHKGQRDGALLVLEHGQIVTQVKNMTTREIYYTSTDDLVLLDTQDQATELSNRLNLLHQQFVIIHNSIKSNHEDSVQNAIKECLNA